MGEIRGIHVLGGMVAGFSIIVGVNVTLAVQAVRTFPGLEVANSYVASQTFDADRAAQEALGWTARAEVAEGELRLALTGPDGAPAEARSVSVLVGRATEAADDIRPALAFDGKVWRAPVELGRGLWHMKLDAVAADGTAFQQRLNLHVEAGG